jgi:hypothetical protein
MSNETHSKGLKCGVFGCVFKAIIDLEMGATLVLCLHLDCVSAFQWELDRSSVGVFKLAILGVVAILQGRDCFQGNIQDLISPFRGTLGECR